MQTLLTNISIVGDIISLNREDLEEILLAVNCYHEFMKALFLKKELVSGNRSGVK